MFLFLCQVKDGMGQRGYQLKHIIDKHIVLVVFINVERNVRIIQVRNHAKNAIPTCEVEITI